MATEKTIAGTIWQQLGGKWFTVATGSKNFIDTGNGLRFSLARNKTSANRCEITYDAGKDLYRVRFYRQTVSKTAFEVKTKDMKVYEDVYCDMLQEIFTSYTGLIIKIF